MILTAKEKRQRHISDALTKCLQGDENWWHDIIRKVREEIDGKPSSMRLSIIMRWIVDCESMAAPIVKGEIKKHFDV